MRKPHRKPRRSRRLLKKLRLGPFSDVTLKRNATVESPASVEGHLDALLADCIEPHDLELGAGANLETGALGGRITRERILTSENDRALVHAWLTERPEVVSLSIGPLQDPDRDLTDPDTR